MSFGRQKRLLLGLLALVAPLPLPFNDIVEWPVLLLYLAGVLLFLRRASTSGDAARWLPNWALNVIGFVYLPFFGFDLLVLGRGRLVHPVIHLCLFALLVKLYSLAREKDKWHVVLGVFFLFLASMGTSVHPSIALYLLVFAALSLLLLTRFAFLHVLAGFGREEPALAALPLRGFMTASIAAIVVFSVPLFTILPRIRTPYIAGRGAGTGTLIEAAGFSDAVTLDSIGVIRNSREVALRVVDETPSKVRPDHELRFKAGTFEIYTAGSWRRTGVRGPLVRDQGIRFRLSREKPERWVKIYLQPIRTRSLPLPVETAVLEPRLTSLIADRGGALSLEFTPLEVVEYRVGMAEKPILLGDVPVLGRPAGPAGDPEPSLDLSGVTPRMGELARQAMGEGTAAERAKRLESHFLKNYGYTTDFRDRLTDNPLEDFLFRYKSGHCEYFASAMVLLLRSQGIPARLVSGFLGGEFNPFEGYTIVRNSNAHAWVEAYLGDGPGEGWQIFDPTPPAGRPAEAQEGVFGLARQAYDFVLFRWDRYVLTYGFSDQLRIFTTLRELWGDLFRAFERKTPGKTARPPVPGVAETAPAAAGEALRNPRVAVGLAGLALLALAVLASWLVRLFRTPLTATRAYRKLRRRLSHAGPPIPDSLPPLAFRHAAARRYPNAAEPTARIVELYLRESFGGEVLEDEDTEGLKETLLAAERGMRKAG